MWEFWTTERTEVVWRNGIIPGSSGSLQKKKKKKWNNINNGRMTVVTERHRQVDVTVQGLRSRAIPTENKL